LRTSLVCETVDLDETSYFWTSSNPFCIARYSIAKGYKKKSIEKAKPCTNMDTAHPA